ncbi:MAG: M28 family peptidase [Acidobacteriota bacterium]
MWSLRWQYRTKYALAAIATWCMLPFSGASLEAGNEAVYGRFDIDEIGAERLQELAGHPGFEWWMELDDQLLVLTTEATLVELERNFACERLDVAPRPERLFVMHGARTDDFPAMDVDVLAMGGRRAVIQARSNAQPIPPHAHHAHMRPFEPNQVLARQSANLTALRQARLRQALLPQASMLAEEVDAQRWFNDVSTLSSYNRYTHGSEILQARDWLVQQFAAMPGLTVETPVFEVGATAAFNVLATLTGSVRPDDLYIVGAHYDATSQSPGNAAPGAEDNASGCAGVLEMARIFTAHPPEATVLFMCYSGEEQGLFGSEDHASGLVSSGLDDQVRAVLTMDMIGYTGDADLDCLLETSSSHSALADAFAAAAIDTDLRTVISFNPFGSDHVPYLNRGMPALLTIENDWDSYPCYHRTCDTETNVSLAMGGETLKMNVVAMAQMIGTQTSLFSDGFESGNASAWN